MNVTETTVRSAHTTTDQSPALDVLDTSRKAVQKSKALMLAQGGTLSYGALFDRISRLGTLFARLQLEEGDRIVIVSDEDIALASIFLAALRHGITTVLINPKSRAAELRAQIAAADPKAIFLDQGVVQRSGPKKSPLPIIEIGPDCGKAPSRWFKRQGRLGEAAPRFPDLLAKLPPSDQLPQTLSEHTAAYILFTSGTTSKPKGVEITHRSLFAQMRTFLKHYGFDDSMRLMNLLPFHHTDGLTQGLVVTLCAGGSLIRPMRMRVNSVAAMLDAVYKHRVTHLVTVPSVLALSMSTEPRYQDSLQGRDFGYVISTAAYLDEQLWRNFETYFGVQVVNVYGLTETVCESLYCGPDPATRKIGTVGKPVDSEAKIVDEHGTELPGGSRGELVLRGDHIMRGYFRMPEATADVVRDGWFHTGDLAILDDEGFIRIVGRKKEVIITAGINVYPEDVNAVLRAIPGVLDAACFGMDADIWGEKVVACVVPAPGAELTPESVTRCFLERTSNEKLPREIHFFDELPRGPAGKVIVEETKRLVQARRDAAATSVTRDGDLRARVMTVAASVFKCRPETLHEGSRQDDTQEWNSLAHVELLLAAEVEFGVRISPAEIMRIATLGDLLKVLRSKRA